MATFITTNYPGIVYYNLKGKDKTFYAKISHKGGKKEWIKMGRASEGMTALRASQLRGEKLQERRHGKKMSKTVILSVEDAVDKYIGLRGQLMSKHQMTSEATFYRRFKEFFSSYYIGDIRESEAEAMILELRNTLYLSSKEKDIQKNLKPQTILHHFKSYRMMFDYLIKENCYDGLNPFNTEVHKVIPRVNNEIVRYFTPDENNKFITALFQNYKDNKVQEFLRNGFGFAFATGLRRGEVFKLEEKDVDLDRQIIHLRNPKSGKDKYVELSDLGRYFFLAQIEAKKKYGVVCEPVFCTCHGTSPWLNFKKKAGLPMDFRFHDLRHNFATLVLTISKDLRIVQRLLTHSKVTTTERYAHLIRGRALTAANEALKDLKLPEEVAKKMSRE
jgi:integrase